MLAINLVYVSKEMFASGQGEKPILCKGAKKGCWILRVHPSARQGPQSKRRLRSSKI